MYAFPLPYNLKVIFKLLLKKRNSWQIAREWSCCMNIYYKNQWAIVIYNMIPFMKKSVEKWMPQVIPIHWRIFLCIRWIHIFIFWSFLFMRGFRSIFFYCAFIIILFRNVRNVGVFLSIISLNWCLMDENVNKHMHLQIR